MFTFENHVMKQYYYIIIVLGRFAPGVLFIERKENVFVGNMRYCVLLMRWMDLEEPNSVKRQRDHEMSCLLHSFESRHGN